MINRAIIDDLRSLDPDGSTGLVAELLKTYIEESKADWAKVLIAWDNEDHDRLTKLAHSLKGSSASIGAELMVTWCERISAWAHQRPGAEKPDLQQAGADLQQTYKRLQEVLG